ncbi:zinc finger BED domain-containing protein RICESLEEPER 2-like [Arachis stenosperma]|uniref:zinc finger BED domain-containing protein RICESLEEPER 2-like n=1 Tax=Arachis stenosperma TaxID=217475 RepID=UPI0025ACC4E8|nr:zinc finger BED domain-containing protein RICESLEEPER 2-like [Arachis stenosperma]
MKISKPENQLLVSASNENTNNIQNEELLLSIDGISSPEIQVELEAEALDNNEGENQSREDEEAEDNEDEGVIHNNKRKKTSFVWQHFKEVKLSNGVVKNQCVHCKRKYAVTDLKATSQLNRHLKNNCPGYRKMMLAKQKKLNFPQSNSAEHPNVIGPMLVTPGGKYDHARQREATSHWLMMHEHSFSIVEEFGFLLMMKCNNTSYEKIGRKTLKSDCLKVYEAEKKKLKASLKDVSKISLTTNLWKSQNQKIEYMVITGHYVDTNWVLQKRVLSFVHVPPPRRGVDIADAIFKCLIEWGIESKIYSISVDNASYNDSCLRTLKDMISRHRKLLCGGKLFHVRCCAHILNLLVQDGLGEIAGTIENIRESVKFINQSEARLRTFSDIVQQLQLPGRKLILDCPTRWNSTYQMISTALHFKEVFPRFQDREPNYRYLPDPEESEKVEKIVEVLQVINCATNIISGSEYPTANLYLAEVFRIKLILDEAVSSGPFFMKEMAAKMKLKFDKYWSECNLLMAVATVLDPRCKLTGLKMCFQQIYGQEATRNMTLVHQILTEMYQEYVILSNEQEGSTSSSASGESSINSTMQSSNSSQTGWSIMINFVKDEEAVPALKSELETYLDEPKYFQREHDVTSFSALEWWKVNRGKYRILSRMAADVLAIPISTVASESTFSAGGRVIDTFRSSLSPTTVEALICGGDWLRVFYGLRNKSKVEDSSVEIALPI